MSAILVVDSTEDWPRPPAGVPVVTASDYLAEPAAWPKPGLKVYNLCSSYRYQRTGYYVSLLAAARGHRPLPDVATIQDLKSVTLPRLLGDELDAVIARSLQPLESERFELSVYFGQNMAQRHQRLARAVYNLFPAPLLRASFRRGKHWQLRKLQAIALDAVPAAHRDFLAQAAEDWFAKRRRAPSRARSAGYDLAILVNPEERDPPSNEQALRQFERAARRQGFHVDRIGRDDYGHLAEYDALFLRETTRVNHHTYRFARRAAAEGLVVMDDPDSILRCTNKVYLAERLQRGGVATPDTLVVHRGNAHTVQATLGLPCVLKQPDSAFSRGVVKVDTAEALQATLHKLLASSDLIVAQAFVPTDFDWRVGMLAGEPLYLCRYHMATAHWQIVRHGPGGSKDEGNADTLPLEAAPPGLLRTAKAAARCIGNGLYGVDIKQVGKRFVVIEVNDNPSIDGGIEDAELGHALYDRVMAEFMRRVTDSKHGGAGDG